MLAGMRIVTWNVNPIVPRLPRVLDFLEQTAPDVLCLQELKSTTEKFPAAEIEALGYEVAAYGIGQWNGVGIVSRGGGGGGAGGGWCRGGACPRGCAACRGSRSSTALPRRVRSARRVGACGCG